jgi:CRISPR-associated protein Cmr5
MTASDQPSMTLEQHRAKHALKNIRDLERMGVSEYGLYRSYVAGLPANIVQQSLGQACATLLAAAKGKPRDAHKILYDHLNTWLCGTHENAIYPNADDLLSNVTVHDEDTYLLAQAEALGYLEWLKKFATAFLKSPNGEQP